MKRNLSVSLCFIILLMSPYLSTAAMQPAEPMPFALTISGGISLGSYEAGVNWALAEYLKQLKNSESLLPGSQVKNWTPELRSITGASAGSINAVMTAMNWCVDPAKRQKLQSAGVGRNRIEGRLAVDNNLIHDVWVDVGIDELFPKNPHQYVNPVQGEVKDILVDGLFARSAFAGALKKMKAMRDLDIFTPGCSVPVALLTTREEPAKLQIGKVTVSNQRFVFSLKFVAGADGKGRFENDVVVDGDGTYGNVVYLPTKAGQISFDNLKKLIFASSAFPVAFGKVKLDYCTEVESGAADNQVCHEGVVPKSAYFVDGGVFDNIPLGTAAAVMASFDKKNEIADEEQKKRYFFFISPETRRNVADSADSVPSKKPSTFGIMGLLSYLPGAIQTSSDYELYTVLKNKSMWSAELESPTPLQKIIPTSRYFPITGAYLGHFGAFLDRPFREFDYYVGVYDAVSNLAEISCRKTGQTLETQASCKGRTAKTIFNALNIGSSAKASTVFSFIAGEEHQTTQNPQSPWGWVAEHKPNVESEDCDSALSDCNIDTVMRSLRKAAGAPAEDDDKKFEAFVTSLSQNGYRPESNLMKRILANHDGDVSAWYAPMVGRAGNRLQKLGADECKDDDKACLRFGTALLALGAGKYFTYNDPITLAPSTESTEDRLYKLIPYEVSGDFVNGGFSLAYLPQIRGRNYSFDLKLTPVGLNKFGRERIWFSQADLYFSPYPGKIFSVGVGPTFNYAWEKPEAFSKINVGAALYAELYKTLRVTAGYRSLHESRHGNNFYLMIGVVDLPGIASRIVRAW